MSGPRNALAKQRGARNAFAGGRLGPNPIPEDPADAGWPTLSSVAPGLVSTFSPDGPERAAERQAYADMRRHGFGAPEADPDAYFDAAMRSGLVDQAMGMTGPTQRTGFLYHVTPRSNARAIAREGLRPDAPKIGEGGPHGETRAVFLADEATVPVYQDLYGTGGEPLSVFRVPRQALRSLQEDMASEGAAYMTSERIPPTALDIETANGWMPVVRRRR